MNYLHSLIAIRLLSFSKHLTNTIVSVVINITLVKFDCFETSKSDVGETDSDKYYKKQLSSALKKFRIKNNALLANQRYSKKLNTVRIKVHKSKLFIQINVKICQTMNHR